MRLKEKDLKNLVYGAAFLGSGGGGAISTGLDFVKTVIKNTKGEGVELLSAEDIFNAHDHACVICDIGAISAIEENQSQAIINAYNVFEKWYFKNKEKKFSSVLPIETGPENSLAPFVLASKKNIPVLNADGAGRAVPELSLCTFALFENSVTASIANDQTDWMLVNTTDASSLDNMLRPVTESPAFHSSASMALWGASLQQHFNNAATGTLKNAIMTGYLLEALRNKDQSLEKEALPEVNKLQARKLVSGKVTDIQHQQKNAFDFELITLKTSDNQLFKVYTQNENLVLIDSSEKQIICQAPESICYLTQSLHPLTNSEIKLNDNIHLIGVASNPKLTTPQIVKGFDGLIKTLVGSTMSESSDKNYLPLGSLLKGIAK
ncbi:DUF917 domain-containing protein [Cytophagaceae bacterium ABcell3]|nr:DUF917 domain-containing protein [Cytophagaceae bacterium ABcell3]